MVVCSCPWFLEVGYLRSFFYVNCQPRCGLVPDPGVCEGSGNGGEGDEGQIPLALYSV